MQKITVRTLLRALAMSPAIALSWGWGRGRANAAPATTADPLTVDDTGVAVKGQLSANKVILPGVKLEGSGGRNLFLDDEKTDAVGAGLRVGAAWKTNGIYSEKGPIVVGSADDTIWLKGGVSIQGGTTAPGKVPEGTLNAAKVTVPGVKIEGTGGRNFFLDEENAGLGSGLRVGAVSQANGIYSHKGPVIIASENNIIWLRGGLGIQGGTTAPTGIPEGGIQAKSISFGGENLRIIRGVIWRRDAIHGTGFKLEDKKQEGIYKIIFTTPFSQEFITPIATSFSGDKIASIAEVEPQYCRIRLATVNALADGAFTFIVIGPT